VKKEDWPKWWSFSMARYNFTQKKVVLRKEVEGLIFGLAEPDSKPDSD
jgi:hypothetical protein